MQFVSLSFFIFLLVTITIYFILPGKVRYIWLLAANLVFYYFAAGKLLLLLLAVALVTYLGGRLLDSERDRYIKAKKAVLSGFIAALLLTLGFFKYTGFLLDTVDSIRSFLGMEQMGVALDIAIPVGISFFIFQAIGYLVDCYRGTVKAVQNPLKLALFLTFFAEITSGPIVRAKDMMPQYDNPKNFDYDRMRDGLLLMMWGYFQKIVIADRLAVVVNNVYSGSEKYPGTVLFLTTVFYTMEIYCDFAGYTSIALGIAKILGIELAENFRQPYLSGTIAEFWRRWHISLSSWLRDYLYIPLGGNRKGYARKLINICIVFAISGLWHGAAWTFVVWGLLHGLYQVAGSLLKPVRDKVVGFLGIDRDGFSHRLFKICVTFMLVNIGWVFFRAPSFADAMYFLTNMWKPTLWVLGDGSLFNLGLSEPEFRLVIVSLVVVTVVDILNYRGIVVRDFLTKQSLWLRWMVYIAAFVFVVTCGVWGPGYDAASFIYSSF